MTPAEIVEGLYSTKPAERDRAGGHLFGLLAEMAPKVLSRFRGAGAPDRADTEDVVSQSALKLIQNCHRIRGREDASIRAYFWSTLRNCWLDVRRTRRRMVSVDEAPEEVVEPEEHADEIDYAPIARGLLDEAFAEVIRLKQPRYHDGLRETWAELQRLTFGGEELDALLAGCLPSDASKQDWTRARNRAFRNHKSLRGYLAEATDSLESTGRTNRSRAEQTRKCLYFLMRCQRETPAFVGKHDACEDPKRPDPEGRRS